MDQHASVKEIEETQRSSFVQYAIIMPAIIFASLTVLQFLFTDSFYAPGIKILYFTLPMSLALSVVQILDKKHSKTRQAIYSILFHLVLGSFIIFAAPSNSDYVFAWVLLIFGAHVNIGRLMTVFSYVSLITVQWMTLVYRDNVGLTSVIGLFITLSLIAVVSQLMIATQAREQRELTALKGSLDRELFERQRLLSLINSMGEAVVATDSKGKILLYNAAVLNLLDTNTSLENKLLDSFLNLKNSSGKNVKIFSLIKNGSVGMSSSDYIHEYGKNDFINLYINVSPIRLSFNEESESGYIVILRDITKQKSLEEERDEFISVVSHELRTPIAIAEGNISNAQFINSEKNDPKMTGELLEHAHKQVIFLSNMINDLATLSRAERTDVELEIVEVDPVALLETMQKDYQSSAEEKGIKLTTSSAKETEKIYTSELYLKEVLQNFITNAIKYTKKGHVIVHVRSNKKGDAIFSISDTGIGLSKADQKLIFEKFFRSEDFRTRESSGTGLGLYVTSKLAARINALIDVESTLNKGSTFTITCSTIEKPKLRATKKA